MKNPFIVALSNSILLDIFLRLNFKKNRRYDSAQRDILFSVEQELQSRIKKLDSASCDSLEEWIGFLVTSSFSDEQYVVCGISGDKLKVKGQKTHLEIDIFPCNLKVVPLQKTSPYL